MAGHEAFLQAIIADPADDVPRLIYADWLEDPSAEGRGKITSSDIARAEFIRVQVDAARLPEGENEKWAPLHGRAMKLLDAHRAEWLPGLPTNVMHSVRFQRGFPESVRLFPENIEDAAAIMQTLACHPITDLEIVWPLFEVLDLQELEEYLISEAGPLDLRRNLLEIIANGPLATCLLGLDLSDTGINDAALEPIANMQNLQSLDLSYTNISNAGLQHIAALPNLEGLYLSLTDYNGVYNGVIEEGILNLVREGGFPKLRGVGGMVNEEQIIEAREAGRAAGAGGNPGTPPNYWRGRIENPFDHLDAPDQNPSKPGRH